jgi:hypothetical protein
MLTVNQNLFGFWFSVFSVFYGFVVFVVFVFLRHLQAAELGAHAGHHPPGAAGAQGNHQLALHLGTVGTRGAQLHVVDADGDDITRARALTGARLVVPAGGEQGRDIVDAVEDGARGCRSSRRLRRRRKRHHSVGCADLLGVGLLGEDRKPVVLVLRVGLVGRISDRRESGRLRRLVLGHEVHTDDRKGPVVVAGLLSLLDGPVLGRAEGLEEEEGRDLVPVEPVVKVARLLLPPLLVVLVVPLDRVAVGTVRTTAHRADDNWEVLPDVLAQPELWDVIVPAELQYADGLLIYGRRALELKVRRRNVVHTEVTPADGMRLHQRTELLQRHTIVIDDGGHF